MLVVAVLVVCTALILGAVWAEARRERRREIADYNSHWNRMRWTPFKRGRYAMWPTPRNR